MEGKQVTLRIPKELSDFLDKKIENFKKTKKLKGKVSYQSLIEALIANWKDEDERYE